MNTVKLVAATLILAAAGVATGIILGRTSAQSRQGAEAHAAICALEHDLDRRVTSSQQFLRTHPHGIAGISAGQIARSIRQTQQSISSFRRSGLTCTP